MYEGGFLNFNKKRELLKSSLAPCYRTLLSFRADSMCLRCSGNSKQYFDLKEFRVKVTEEVCKTILENCSTVFSYFAEATSFFRRLAQIRKAAGGSIQKNSKALGLNQKDLKQLRICGQDLQTCLDTPSIYLDICKHVGLLDLNPDLEGELSTLNDGVKGLINVMILPSSGRRLSEVKTDRGNQANWSLTKFLGRSFSLDKKESSIGVLETLKYDLLLIMHQDLEPT